MSERNLSPVEFEPTPAITAALQEWLQAEIESSMSGRNAVLDDWNTFQKDLHLPFEGSKSQNARKAISHYDRLRIFTLAAEEDSTLLQEDEYLARQLFCAQMAISGAYRQQCFLQASSAEEYRTRRLHGRPTGIDLQTTVASRLGELGPDLVIPSLGYHDNPWANLSKRTEQVNEQRLQTAQEVHERAQLDAGREESPSVHLLREEQERWTALAVDYIVFAAQDRGQPEAWSSVPFLEPKSISEVPEIYYPFRSDS